MNPKISIIIPVYNVEKYIGTCISSILMQTDIDFKRDVEVIIINDGTKDNSIKIAEQLVTNHENITIVNQDNKGLSAARNAGLHIAKGEYVWFIDSDDSIEKDALNTVWDYLNSKNEIISISTNICYELSGQCEYCPKGNLTQGFINSKIWIKRGYVYPYSGVQFYIFKRELLNRENLRFKEGVYFEDLLFTTQAICKSKYVYHIIKPIYRYLVRDGSITSSMTLKKWNDFLVIADELNDIASAESDINKKKIYNSCISIIGGVSLKASIKKLQKNEQSIARKNYLQRNYWLKSMINSYKRKYIIRYFETYFNMI